MISEEVDLSVKVLKHLTSECNPNNFNDFKSLFENYVSIPAQNKAIETVLSYIEELEKDVKDAMDGYNDLGEDLAFNFISKEDIRDKIKELEEKLKYIGGCDGNCKKCFNSERGNGFEYCFAYHQIKVLKSIIGE